MNIKKDFDEIMKYAHFWNWVPDLSIVQEIYDKFPTSYSVLTPFVYSYLEELIRSTTSEYGRELIDKNGDEKLRNVGGKLIKLAIEENSNKEYNTILKEIEKYFYPSKSTDCGDNRHSVAHGYMHPRYWDKDSFEKLIHDIARISKYARF